MQSSISIQQPAYRPGAVRAGLSARTIIETSWQPFGTPRRHKCFRWQIAIQLDFTKFDVDCSFFTGGNEPARPDQIVDGCILVQLKTKTAFTVIVDQIVAPRRQCSSIDDTNDGWFSCPRSSDAQLGRAGFNL